MTRRTTRHILAAFAGTAVAVTAMTMMGSAAAPKFYQDDPIWVERDTEDASSMKPTELTLLVDLGYNFIAGQDAPAIGRAKNINTVDEVPNSSWYTNRVGSLPLTPADIAKGPNTTDGPAPGTWTVTSSKSDGVTPGFTIKDASGQRWFLKFDPPGHGAMATGTEVAVTKLMWALGYNVPENHVAYLTRSQLVLGSSATFTPASGNTRPMRDSDIDHLLERADREPNGSYRIVASKALPGTPIGRIRFFDTRSDDPNDIVPHQDRRELRGYGVFAAWLNHVDAKAINSLDTLITEDGRSVVRHHLIDFGSSLGSGGVGPAEYSAGSEYLLEPRKTSRQMISLGLWFPKWHTQEFYESRAIGRLPESNRDFNPELWKPRVPNQAFLHARSDDKFWAARKLTAISRDMLRAAVRTGEFGDPNAEEFLVRALAERRDAIATTYLTTVNPIVDPALEEGVLTFRNAAVDADVAKAPQGYLARWSRFDNATHSSNVFADTASGTTTIEAPSNLPRGTGVFMRVEVSAIGAANSSWAVPVNLYFQKTGNTWRLVGFERMME